MIALARLLSGLAVVLDMLLGLYLILIIVDALLSWVNPDPYNPIVRFLRSATEPALRPIRKYIPPIGGSIDITPIIAIALIIFLQEFLVGSINDYAQMLRIETLRGS